MRAYYYTKLAVIPNLQPIYVLAIFASVNVCVDRSLLSCLFVYFSPNKGRNYLFQIKSNQMHGKRTKETLKQSLDGTT